MMRKQAHSLRTVAAAHHVSHTSMSRTVRLNAEAEARGLGDEFTRLVMNEKLTINAAVKRLMPDIYFQDALKQRIAALRSAATKLVEEHGYDFDQLVDLLDCTIGPTANQNAMREARTRLDESDADETAANAGDDATGRET